MRLIYLLFITAFISSCSDADEAPDVSGIQVNLQLQRFEPALFGMDTNNIARGLEALSRQFPNFYPFYMQQILHLPPAVESDPAATGALRQVIGAYRPVYDSLQKKYPSLDWYRTEMEAAFRYVKHYYPGYRLPALVSFIGTFDAPGVVLTPTHLGIGLHQYAGKNFSIYTDPQLLELYPVYISRRFDKEYMTASSMKAVVDDIYPDSTLARPLIEQMVEKGKQWYLLDHFLPGHHDSVKTGYTGRQLEWCGKNEGNIWGYITKNTDIYTIDPEIIKDYIGEGPFTRGMPEGYAPGNIGQWIGWQIVRKFAEKNSGYTLQQVLATPARTLFTESKYKPK